MVKKDKTEWVPEKEPIVTLKKKEVIDILQKLEGIKRMLKIKLQQV